MKKLLRGEVVLVDLGDTIGKELKKTRPCIIVQNSTGNKFSPTTIIIPITNRENRNQPTQVEIKEDMVKNSIRKISGMALAEQVRTIDRSRIIASIGMISEEIMREIDVAVLNSFGIKIAG